RRDGHRAASQARMTGARTPDGLPGSAPFHRSSRGTAALRAVPPLVPRARLLLPGGDDPVGVPQRAGGPVEDLHREPGAGDAAPREPGAARGGGAPADGGPYTAAARSARGAAAQGDAASEAREGEGDAAPEAREGEGDAAAQARPAAAADGRD